MTEEISHSLECHIHWKLDPPEEIKAALQDIFSGSGVGRRRISKLVLFPYLLIFKRQMDLVCFKMPDIKLARFDLTYCCAKQDCAMVVQKSICNTKISQHLSYLGFSRTDSNTTTFFSLFLLNVLLLEVMITMQFFFFLNSHHS